jgi:hypothetical protein
VYIDSPRGGFTLAFQTYMDFYLIGLIPSLLTLYHPAPLLFTSLQCISLYSNQIQMECFCIFHSLTFSFPLLPYVVPPDRPTNTTLFSLFLYIYIHIYIYVCILCLYFA